MKKVIRKILLTILVIFLLLTVLPIAYFFIYGFFLRGNISEEKVNYLKANSIYYRQNAQSPIQHYL